MKKSVIALAAAAALSAGVATVANACTTLVYNNGDAAISVRTMDWYGHDDAQIVGEGKGMKHTYAQGSNAVTTKAKYASMKIVSFLPGIVAEAMNEEGLEAHLLYLGTDYTSFAEPTEAKQDVDALQVAQWAVDNFKTVEEVVANLEKVDVVNSGVCGLPPHNDMAHCSETAPVHFQFADRNGDTAVVEFVGGEMKIYRGEGTAYMSNDPEFSAHLIMDKEFTKADGSIRPYDRRLRGKTIVEDMYARDVKDATAAKNSMKAAANNVFAGYDQLDKNVGDVFPTLWTVHTDRNAGEWVFDRYDTWNVETYNFSMFDTNKPERQPMGIHPTKVMYQGK
ncbi:linear amide C-N hydrolase [Paraferrimonas sedimenticola]|uniref:Choloylglycine hydrolase n=1 Tax=Paraferrimonas sedimenticola TaxID=375674 RepID=A0AA37RUN3_9GAMM|nr:linear amide C-N hydrolase [Paraferrimonas sedimenticola]GLP95686.1 choloylglycine hydrolase [Paraferrimonas sedimenticola]